MPNLTKFQESWFRKTDSAGNQVKQWCRADNTSPHKAFCMLCCKSIQCSNSGFKQLLHHAEGKRHSDLAVARFGKTQKHLQKGATSTRPSSSSPPLHNEASTSSTSASTSSTSASTSSTSYVIQSPSLQEKIATAEILWALKVAQSNYSYSSCDATPALFKRMFPGDVAEHFSMSKSKVSYLLSDGLGPHFRREMCASICETKRVFTLQYDETANTQNRKQCDLLLRYWSEAAGEIRVQFLKALMFGHAKGKDVSMAILETLQEEGYQLPLAQLISLGSDGPNVNKTIWNLINEHMKTNGLHGILAFIPCNLHIVHNAFRQGLNIFGEQAEQLVLDLFFFLKASPCRKEYFFETQLGLGLDSGLFINHVQSRWLTLIPAVKRVLICWDAVKKYFLIELPRIMAKEKKEASLKNNERYKRICQKIKNPEIFVHLHFLQNLESVFHPFLTLFQKEEPLIHILYHKLSELLRTIMFRFLKPGVVGENTGKNLKAVELSKPENQLSDQLIEVGETTRKKALKKPKPGQEKGLLLDVRMFSQTTTKYLMDRLPIGRGIVRDLSCLNPLLQKEPQGMQAVQRTARKLPQIITEEEFPLLTDEWRVYQAQDIPENWYILGRKEDGTTEYERVDHYWQKVLDQKNVTGSPRYKILAKLVKAGLCLAHGNERCHQSNSVRPSPHDAYHPCLDASTPKC